MTTESELHTLIRGVDPDWGHEPERTIIDIWPLPSGRTLFSAAHSDREMGLYLLDMTRKRLHLLVILEEDHPDTAKLRHRAVTEAATWMQRYPNGQGTARRLPGDPPPVLNTAITRPTNAELHDVSVGAAGLYEPWWIIDHDADTEKDGYTVVDQWQMHVSIYDLNEGDAGEGDPVDTCRLTADKIWAAALAIASGAIPYVTTGTVRQCQLLVYAGADATDFDQYTADELLQTTVLGWPHYS